MNFNQKIKGMLIITWYSTEFNGNWCMTNQHENYPLFNLADEITHGKYCAVSMSHVPITLQQCNEFTLFKIYF